MSEEVTNIRREYSFLYQLNEDGVNIWSASIQPGHTSYKVRTPRQKTEEIARLFAAAPDLLAACEATKELPALYEIIEYGPGGTTEEQEADKRIAEIHAQIAAAIAKAKGEGK